MQTPASGGAVEPGASGGALGDGDDAQSGGASTGTGGASGGAPAVNEPGLGTLGEPCPSPGELSCAQSELKLTLVCDADGRWVSNGACEGSLVCDPGDANRGSCQEPIEFCVDEEPGHVFCIEDKNFECGERPTDSIVSGDCNLGCDGGVCSPLPDECLPGIVHSCASDCGGPVDCATTPLCSGFTERSGTWPNGTRIPAAVDLCESEETGCEWGAPSAIRLIDGPYVRVELPEDWNGALVAFDQATDFHMQTNCALPRSSGCLSLSDNTDAKFLLLFPTREDAAARNIEIEYSDTPLECP